MCDHLVMLLLVGYEMMVLMLVWIFYDFVCWFELQRCVQWVVDENDESYFEVVVKESMWL